MITLPQDLLPGKLVIVSDTDLPSPCMIAVTERYEDKVWHCRYLAADKHMKRPIGAFPTPVADFGVKVVFGSGHFCALQTGASRATYENGEPRYWHPVGSPIQKINREALNIRLRALGLEEEPSEPDSTLPYRLILPSGAGTAVVHLPQGASADDLKYLSKFIYESPGKGLFLLIDHSSSRNAAGCWKNGEARV